MIFFNNYIILIIEKKSRGLDRVMADFITNLVGNNYIATIIMSFMPMIELKGGILFARASGLGFFEGFLFSYLGSSFVFIPIYFLLRPILNLLKKIKWINSFVLSVENYFSEKAEKAIEKQKKQSKKARSEIGFKQLAVFIFIAIPLPMTGVWMGTAIAVFLQLKFKDAIWPSLLGNFVAGVCIALLAQLCLTLWNENVLNYILYGMFGIAFVLTVAVIIKLVVKKRHSQDEGKKE